jgi:hypothetical protein
LAGQVISVKLTCCTAARDQDNLITWYWGWSVREEENVRERACMREVAERREGVAEDKKGQKWKLGKRI